VRLAICTLAILAAFSVFFTGDIVSGDNIVQFYQTLQLVDRHRVTFATEEVARILQTNDRALNNAFGVNRDGVTYSQVHGLGQSILAAPLFVTARAVRNAAGRSRPGDMTLWTSSWPLFATLFVLLTMNACRLVGVRGVTWNTLIPFAAAFASPILMFSTLPYNVLGETLVIAAAISLCLWFDSPRGGDRRANPAAIAAALALVLVFGIIVRPFFAAAVPAFAGWFAHAVYTGTLSRPRKHRVFAVFACVLSVGGAALAAYNILYFGSPLQTPYHDLSRVMTFDAPWLVGFSGTFLSPLKSPLYFFPIVILLPIALGILAYRREPLTWFCVAFLIPQLYLMPKYSLWDGGPDLFARFWLRIVPIAFLSLAAVVAQGRLTPAGRACLLAAVLCLAAAGLRAELLTVMTDEREIYAVVAAEITAGNPGSDPLAFRESIPALLTGRTLASRLQVNQLTTPRRFLAFRDSPDPLARFWAAAACMLAAALAMAAASPRLK
jgi:hypothetical protein